MSICIPAELLEQEQITKIKKEFTLTPKVTGFMQSKHMKWARQTKIEDTVSVWRVFSTFSTNKKGEKTREKYLQLPYYKGRKFLERESLQNPNLCQLGDNPNEEKNFSTKNFKFKEKLRPYQKKDAKIAVEYLNEHRSVLLELFPSYGKTVLTSYLTSLVKGRTLVLLNRTNLIKQWITTFNNFTTANAVEVKSGSQEYEDVDVLVCMNGRISYIPEEILADVQTLVLDESHMLCTKGMVNSLLVCSPLYVIVCSATLEKENGMEDMVFWMCGKKSRIIREDPRPFLVRKIETGIPFSIPLNKRGTPDWSNYVKQVSVNEARNRLILKRILLNLEEGHKIIVLTARVDHANKLLKMCKEEDISCDKMVGNKKGYKDSDVLIGSMSKIGTGFDEATYCEDFSGVKSDLIILTSSIKNCQVLKQNVGRVFRADCPIIEDLKDEDPISTKHWRARRKYYLDPIRNGTIKILAEKKQVEIEFEQQMDAEQEILQQYFASFPNKESDKKDKKDKKDKNKNQ